jgi:hypothetical protein
VTQLEVDPDPTPTATPWEEYLAAAQALDAVRRDLAAATAAAKAAAETAATTARAELTHLEARLAHQRAAITGEVIRAGLPAPQLLPTAEEHAEARALIPDPTAVPTALIRAAALADAGDAALFQPAPPPVRRWWPPPRWVQLTGLASTVVLVMGVAALLWLLLLG